MEWNIIIPILFALATPIGTFYKIREYSERKAESAERDIKEYIDKEINHLADKIEDVKNSATINNSQLEKKLDEIKDSLREYQRIMLEIIKDRR